MLILLDIIEEHHLSWLVHLGLFESSIWDFGQPSLLLKLQSSLLQSSLLLPMVSSYSFTLTFRKGLSWILLFSALLAKTYPLQTDLPLPPMKPTMVKPLIQKVMWLAGPTRSLGNSCDFYYRLMTATFILHYMILSAELLLAIDFLELLHLSLVGFY